MNDTLHKQHKVKVMEFFGIGIGTWNGQVYCPLLRDYYAVQFYLLFTYIWRVLFLDTVNSPNRRHFGTQASVLIRRVSFIWVLGLFHLQFML